MLGRKQISLEILESLLTNQFNKFLAFFFAPKYFENSQIPMLKKMESKTENGTHYVPNY